MNEHDLHMLQQGGTDVTDMLDAVIQRDTPHSLHWLERYAEWASTREEVEKMIDAHIDHCDAGLEWVGVRTGVGRPKCEPIEIELVMIACPVDQILRDLEGTRLDPAMHDDTDETDGTDDEQQRDTDARGSSRRATVKFLQAKMEQVSRSDMQRYVVVAGPCDHARPHIDGGVSPKRQKVKRDAISRLPVPLRHALRSLRTIGVLTDAGTPACSACKYESLVRCSADMVRADLPIAGAVYVPAAPSLPRRLRYCRPENFEGSYIFNGEEFRAGLPPETIGQLIEAILDHQDIEYQHARHDNTITITSFDAAHTPNDHPGSATVVEPHAIGEEHNPGTDDAELYGPDSMGEPELYAPSHTSVEVGGEEFGALDYQIDVDEAHAITRGEKPDVEEMLSEARKRDLGDRLEKMQDKIDKGHTFIVGSGR